jgi:hypothetical protein
MCAKWHRPVLKLAVSCSLSTKRIKNRYLKVGMSLLPLEAAVMWHYSKGRALREIHCCTGGD